MAAVIGWAHARRDGRPWVAPIHRAESAAGFDAEYDVLEVIGRGGFGEVHRALHRSTGVEVALKVLRASRQADDGQIEQEIETMSKVSSAYSVSVVEAYAPCAIGDLPVAGSMQRQLSGESSPASGGPFWRIVLEMCSGRNLDDVLKEQGALAPEALRAVASQLGTATLHIHSCGVVHRDIKPGNVMVEGGEPGGSVRIKLIDFGLAVALERNFVRQYTESLQQKTSSGRIANMYTVASGILSKFSPQKAYTLSPDDARSAERRLTTSPEEASRPSKRPSRDQIPRSPEHEHTTDSLASRASFEAAAAGTKGYAAPELLDARRYSSPKSGSGSMCPLVRVTVLTDAFSLGCVLRYCATGVPPEEDVGEFISTRTGNPVFLVARMVRACRGRPVARYRYMSEVSEEVRGLIKGLTEANPDQRLSVTQLCQSAYIAEAPGLTGNPFSQPPDAVVAILKDPSDVQAI